MPTDRYVLDFDAAFNEEEEDWDYYLHSRVARIFDEINEAMQYAPLKRRGVNNKYDYIETYDTRVGKVKFNFTKWEKRGTLLEDEIWYIATKVVKSYIVKQLKCIK